MSARGENEVTLDPIATRPEAGVSTAIAPRPAGLDGLPADASSAGDGQRLGRYLIAARIGSGGMGTVYRAYDPELDRGVAIKVMHPGNDRGSQGSARARILREAQAMAKLSHRNVVSVFDVGTMAGDDGQVVFIAMEYVAGGTLREWLRREPRSWRDVLDMFLAAGDGLAAAHRAGVVHRDFKPENVLIGVTGPLVADFGLARPTGENEGERPAAIDSGSVRVSQPLTRTGAVVGTPAYMAPEQHAGDETDARTDQFAFAVALWESLYGERPFEGETLAALSYNVLRGRMRAPRAAHAVPRRMHDTIVRALAVEPDERWPSMDVMLATLRRRLRPWWQHPGGFALLGLAALGGAAVLAGDDDRNASLCSGSRAELDGVWDDARREHVERAFASTDAPFVAPATERVVTELDAWSETWTAAHRDACEATRIRGVQSESMLDRRMVCLARRRDNLRATVDVFADADAEVVRTAVAIVEGLPSIDECSDLVRLEQNVDYALPADVRAAADEGWADLAELQALRFAGRFDEWDTKEAALTERFGDLRAPSFRAALELERAQIRARMRRSSDAEALAEQAFLLAEEAGDDGLKAKAAMTLMTVVGYQQARLEDAERWERLARSVLRRLGDPEVRVAALDRASATWLHAAGRYPEALAASERGLEVMRRLEPHKLLRIADAMNNRATILNTMGRHDDALAIHAEVLRLRLDALGPLHPDVGMTYNNLGSVHLDRGDAATSAEWSRKALDVWGKSLPPDHADLAMGHNNLGNALAAAKQYDSAMEQFETAIRIWTGAHGPDHVNVQIARNNQARLLFLLGRYEDAMELSLEALGKQATRLGDDHADLVWGHNNVSDAARRLGRLDLAVLHGARGREIASEKLGASSVPALLAARLELAALLARKQGDDITRAIALADTAWPAAEGVALAPDDRARLALVVAQALREGGREPASLRALVDEARRHAAAVDDPELDGEIEAFASLL